MKRRTVDVARGKWRGVLLTLGIEARFLTGKHGPCPLCGGKDRYRWDNRNGDGTYFCSGCGAGNAMDLLMAVKGWDFKKAAQEVDQVVGNVSAEPVKQAMPEARRVSLLNDLWLGGVKVRDDSPVAAYLAMRGCSLPDTDCLRYVENCPVPDGGTMPAMVAMVMGPDGKPATLHRTFLGPRGKADMPNPRALMPGGLAEGSAVRLSLHGERLGIAEGIETARASTRRFGLPCWAALNSVNLAKWRAPEGVRSIVIFGDNDPKFGGAAAAYECAHRNAVKGVEVEVRIPQQIGLDWADEAAA